MTLASTPAYTDHFSDGYQRHILAVLCRMPGMVMRFRSALSHEYFSTDVSRAVARALFEHVDSNKHIPTDVSLREEAKRFLGETHHGAVDGFVTKLYDADITDANAVVKTIVDFGQNQALCNAVIQAAELIEKRQRTKVKSVMDAAYRVGQDLIDVGHDYVLEYEKRADLYTNPVTNTDQYIPTGLTHVDMALGGGLGRGQLGLVACPPKSGKSTFLINVGFGAAVSACGFNVVHYSCEMSERDVSRRYDDRLLGGLSRVREQVGIDIREMLRVRIQKFVKGHLFIKAYPTRTATASMLRSHLSLLTGRGFPPDVVIVDYADIMRAERRLGEVRHEAASIYEDLRTIAGEFNCAVWTASQTNRGSLDKETIDMADLAETFEKAAIVDALIGLSQTEDEAINKSARLHFAALRHQEDGGFAVCVLDRARCRITTTDLYDVSGQRVFDGSDKPSPLGLSVQQYRAKQAGRSMIAGNDDHRGPRRMPGKKVPQ